MEVHKSDIRFLMTKLNHQTNTYLAEIKKLANQIQKVNQLKMISYFTHSLNISHQADQESMCLGSYHIYNAGNQPITNPRLCILIPKDSPFSFSGKYVYEDFKQNMKGTASWLRMNERTNTEEFWLKPLETKTVQPGETLSFTNFQIVWTHKMSYAGSVKGYTYCDEQQEGVGVINPINIGGTVQQQL